MNISIFIDGFRCEDSFSSLCDREGIPANLHYRWSKDFLEAGKKCLAGDTNRETSSNEMLTLKKKTST
jgi:transposase